jgi:hypothetical protein
MASHRGPHPEDEEQFAGSALPTLRAAVHDLAWLRSRGYGDSASLSLVGDRYQLKRRQRNAVARSACTDGERVHRLVRRRNSTRLEGDWVDVDGFNLLISVEGLLGGAYLFEGRDQAYRDVDPVQGTYRIVEETAPAIRGIRSVLVERGAAGCTWWLDDTVSNVGRLKSRLTELAPSSIEWDIVISEEVDDCLAESDRVVATSDSKILDRVQAWCALEQLVHAGLSDTAPRVLRLCSHEDARLMPRPLA